MWRGSPTGACAGLDHPVRKSITSRTNVLVALATASPKIRPKVLELSDEPLARDAGLELARDRTAEPLERLVGGERRVEVVGDRHRCVMVGATSHESPPARRERPGRSGSRLYLHTCGVGIAGLVDDELPEATRRAGRAEVLEVEGEDRSSHVLRDSHHAAVDETKVEVREACVDLDRAAQKPSGEERNCVLTRGKRVENQMRRARTDARAEKADPPRPAPPGNNQLPPGSVTSATAKRCALSRRFAAATSGPVSATTLSAR